MNLHQAYAEFLMLYEGLKDAHLRLKAVYNARLERTLTEEDASNLTDMIKQWVEPRTLSKIKESLIGTTRFNFHRGKGGACAIFYKVDDLPVYYRVESLFDKTTKKFIF